jgi:murein DD-endopeptidase MepM/ murein hydrolase activator NlpD
VSQRSGKGRHCRRRRHVSLPSVVGSFAVLAAASGTLTMPQAGASSELLFSSEALKRPEATHRGASGLDTVIAAGQSLKEESAEGMGAAHEAAVEQQRKEAAEREARRIREAQRWVAPLTGRYRVSATFGSTGRLWASAHTGVDLSASYGAEVVSLSTGEIIWTGYDGPFGNKIVVRHWDGTETWYCHLSRIIKRSGTVTPGEVIGAVGSTGNSTGPHLHLEVHPSGSGPVNPQTWLADRGVHL